MKLERKIRILIFFCIIVLAGLVSIQYYLIKEAYHFQKEKYIREIRDSVSPVILNPELLNVMGSIHPALRKLSVKKHNHQLNEVQIEELIRKSEDSVRIVSNNFIKSEELKYPILKEVKVRSKFTQVIAIFNSMPDTLLSVSDKPIITFGSEISDSADTFRFDNGNGYDDSNVFDDSGKLIAEKYRYEVLFIREIEVPNWREKVFLRMSWMLISAIATILAAIFSFYWMYNSLIRQKKIAEAKSDFANNITHELKTPLTTLNLIVSSLQKEITEQNRQPNKDLIDSLARQNNRIRNVVDRILETSMLHHTTYLQNVDVVRFLNEFISDYKSETHKLKTEISPGKLFIKTDTYQLGRVLQNLVDNAQKYSPGKTEIILRSYIKNDLFAIEVQDFGTGIPRKQQKKVFEKFYRVSQGNMHDVKGLGLGLFLCKEIMKELGGSVSIKKNPEKGSIFKIRLPT